MSVNARFLLIKNNALGTDPLVDKILTEGSAERALYDQALAINKSSLKRRYLEACLLASSDFGRIADILEMSVDLVVLYSMVFYDVADLDKLSKLELLEVKDREEHAMKVWALSQGLEFIEWRLGRMVSLNPVDGLRDLFTMATFKAKESLFSGNASEASKEGTKWAKLSMDLARLLKAWVLDSDAAKKDIELALREVVPEFDGYDSLDRGDFNGAELAEEQPEFPGLDQLDSQT